MTCIQYNVTHIVLFCCKAGIISVVREVLLCVDTVWCFIIFWLSIVCLLAANQAGFLIGSQPAENDKLGGKAKWEFSDLGFNIDGMLEEFIMYLII